MAVRANMEQAQLLANKEQQLVGMVQSQASIAMLEMGPNLSREEKAEALVKLKSHSVCRASKPGQVSTTTIEEALERLDREELATQRRLDAARRMAQDEQRRLESMEHRSLRRATRSMAMIQAEVDQRKQAVAAQLETWRKGHEHVEMKFVEQEEQFRKTKSELEYKGIAKEQHIEADREAAAVKRREKFDAVAKNLEYRQQVVATAKQEHKRRCSEARALKEKTFAEAKAKVEAERAAEQLRRQEAANEAKARTQARREAAAEREAARKRELKEEIARKDALRAERMRVKEELVESRIRESEVFELEKRNLRATLDSALAQ